MANPSDPAVIRVLRSMPASPVLAYSGISARIPRTDGANSHASWKYNLGLFPLMKREVTESARRINTPVHNKNSRKRRAGWTDGRPRTGTDSSLAPKMLCRLGDPVTLPIVLEQPFAAAAALAPRHLQPARHPRLECRRSLRSVCRRWARPPHETNLADRAG